MDFPLVPESSSIACFHICDGFMHIILKLNIMKSKSYTSNSKEQAERTNLWDAFVNYLENTYFPGASELLDTKLIAFEYEIFRDIHST